MGPGSQVKGLLEIAEDRAIHQEDILPIPTELCSGPNSIRLSSAWLRNSENSTIWKRCALPLACISVFKGPYAYCGLILALSSLATMTGPVLLSYLVHYYENGAPPATLVFLVALLVLSRVLMALFSTHYTMLSGSLKIAVGAAVNGCVYHKLMHLSTNSRRGYSAGNLTNLYVVDVNRFTTALVSFHNLWALPLQIFIGLVLLYQTLSYAMFAGLAVMTVVFYVNTVVGNQQKRYNDLVMSSKDERMKHIGEFLSSVLTVKLNCWEPHFRETIFRARREELDRIRGLLTINSSLISLFWLAPSLMMVSSLVVYTKILGMPVTASKIFTAVSVFRLIQDPLKMFPWAISQIYVALASVNRLEAFFAESNKDGEVNSVQCSNEGEATTLTPLLSTKHESYGGSNTGGDNNFSEKVVELVPTKNLAKGAIYCSNLSSFGWFPVIPTKVTVEERSGSSGVTSSFVIRFAETCEVQPGELVVIEGMVGSGKSSLCSALLGEMYEVSQPQLDSVRKASSGFQLNGSVAYATQQPWIQNMTLRNNILFGRPFDESWYNQVVAACCLMADFDELPERDFTEIGERGLTLSGGQKARVALARAVYSNADIIIMDDVLSALDAIVAKKVFEHCILGILGKKTRILVTHNPDVIEHTAVTLVWSTENGTVTWVRLTPSSDRALSLGHRRSYLERLAPVIEDTGPLKKYQEDRAEGSIDKAVYSGYLEAMGGWSVVLFLLLVQFVWQLASISSDLFLAWWCKQSDSAQKAHLDRNLEFYSVLSIGAGGVVFIRTVTVMWTGYSAARWLFERLMSALLAAPMAWFDRNPSGRVLNRVGNDQAKVDVDLIFAFGTMLECSFALFGDLTAVLALTRYLVIVVIPVFFVYRSVLLKYLSASREIQRIQNMSQSPLLTFLSESISGVYTIRAFGTSTMSRFNSRNQQLVDENSRASYCAAAISAWLGFRIQIISSLILLFLCAALFSGLVTLSPGYIGMCLAYGLSFTTGLQSLVLNFAALENTMVCPERILQYARVEPEGTYEMKCRYMRNGAAKREEIENAQGFPKSGKIQFDDVHFRYQLDGDEILHGVNFTIPSGNKVGVVGRTGSGKSTLSMCLFRIAELTAGRILIDDIDIATLPLSVVRSSMEIIPQMPVLFKGSVRHYLDPFNEYSTDSIWSALEKAQLLDVVTSLSRRRTTSELRKDNEESVAIDVQPDKETVLQEARIEENGENLSVGERQLLVLSRALLRKAKILVMDEATASVDVKTDQKIQTVLRDEFRSSTVFTIAHRIDTILHSDHIIVMNAGKVAEFGSPGELLLDPTSLFRALAYS